MSIAIPYRKKKYGLYIPVLKGLDQLPPFRSLRPWFILRTITWKRKYEKVNASLRMEGMLKGKSRLEREGGYNFVPLCRVHNWFDGRKGYWWYRYLYVSRGGGGTKGPARSALKCVFSFRALLCVYTVGPRLKGPFRRMRNAWKVVWMDGSS